MVFAVHGLYTLSCVGAVGDKDWTQLSRLHLETETEYSPRNVVFKKTRRWIMSRYTIVHNSNLIRTDTHTYFRVQNISYTFIPGKQIL
jgi:hypothetical protein